ncbi:MAG: hypothetical protein B7Z78_10710, partial [Rhodospirillales bacterium 20-60-12]
TPDPLALTLKERFDQAIKTLRVSMGFAMLHGGVSRAVLCALDARIGSILSRFHRALARGARPAKSTKPIQNPLGQTPPSIPRTHPRPVPSYLRHWVPAYFDGQPPPKLGTAFGAARRAMNSYYAVNAAIQQLSHLLAQPQVTDQIETNPALGRILRPLCHMLGIHPPPCLQRSRREAPKKPARTPRPKPKPRARGFSLIAIHPERCRTNPYAIPPGRWRKSTA